MYKCDRCGKEFAYAQGLGGHRAYCKGGVSEGQPSLPSVRVSKQLQKHPHYPHSTLTTLTKPSERGLTEANRVAERAWETGHVSHRRRHKDIPWGRVVLCAGIAVLVFYLMWQNTEGIEWKNKKAKPINAGKLVGAVIAGLA